MIIKNNYNNMIDFIKADNYLYFQNINNFIIFLFHKYFYIFIKNLIIYRKIILNF